MTRLSKILISILSKKLNFIEPIYDMGSRQQQGQEFFADVRPFFPNKEFIGVDYIDGLGVDKVMDIENLDLLDKSVGSIICMDVFEHTKKFWKATDEFKRVLKNNGLIFLLTCGAYPIHAFPNDYWRFTPQGIESLFEDFENKIIISGGKKTLPKVTGVIAFNAEYKIDKSLKDELIYICEEWGKEWKAGLED